MNRLPRSQIQAYREQAKRILSEGYNLFAEITLRVLASHDAQELEIDLLRQALQPVQAELEQMRRAQREQEIEIEFLRRENDDLRAHIAEGELERKRLAARVKEYQRELSNLKRQKLKLPPSWNNQPPAEK
jgi:predicted RNase H-like nuclease (RuvC/YqgF family)